jgi:hypothetical protein
MDGRALAVDFFSLFLEKKGFGTRVASKLIIG